MVGMGKLVSNAHYCNCNEHKNIFPHKTTSEMNIYKFLTGIWLEKRQININEININTFHLRFQCFELSIGWTTSHATGPLKLLATYLSLAASCMISKQNRTHCWTYHSKHILDNKIHNLTNLSTKVSTKIDIPIIIIIIP